MTPAHRLGVLLSDLRAQRGLTQEQVAAAAGISRNHLQLLESGLGNRDGSPANPRLSTLQGLATVLGTDVPALVSAAFTDDYGTVGIEAWDAEPPVDLPPELDTSDPDTLATLLLRAFTDSNNAEYLEALVSLGGSLPPGALGGPISSGAYEVRCTQAVKDVLEELRGTKPKEQKRRKVEKALRLLREVGPEHPGLNSHRYDDLYGNQGEDVWESYIEHKTANAWRAWWYFMVDSPRTILVAAVGPHPKRSLPALPAH